MLVAPKKLRFENRQRHNNWFLVFTENRKHARSTVLINIIRTGKMFTLRTWLFFHHDSNNHMVLFMVLTLERERERRKEREEGKEGKEGDHLSSFCCLN